MRYYSTQTETISPTWTAQLKLLVRLYHGAINELRKAQLAEDPTTKAKAILRAQRLVLEILAGLDPSHGEVPAQVERLCLFCSQCLERQTQEDLKAAEHVLTVLADAFNEIVGDVQNLESEGELPRARQEQSVVNHVA